MTPDMKLEEPEIRRKVIELLDGMNMTRMNMWLGSGTLAGVIDSELAERVLLEEMPRRSHEVVTYWMGICNCHGHLN